MADWSGSEVVLPAATEFESVATFGFLTRFLLGLPAACSRISLADLAHVPHWVPTLSSWVIFFQAQPFTFANSLIMPSVTAWQLQIHMVCTSVHLNERSAGRLFEEQDGRSELFLFLLSSESNIALILFRQLDTHLVNFNPRGGKRKQKISVEDLLF